MSLLGTEMHRLLGLLRNDRVRQVTTALENDIVDVLDYTVELERKYL